MKTFLIDGYNLLYALAEIPPGSLEEKRRALIRMINERRPQGKNRAILVFDGREDGAGEIKHGDLRSIFTSGETADEWIARKVRVEPNPRVIVVVSNDQGIRHMVRGTGAQFLTATEFLSKPPGDRPPLDPDEPPEDPGITDEFKKKWL